jgi:exopolysaccharide production protein ExoZ
LFKLVAVLLQVSRSSFFAHPPWVAFAAAAQHQGKHIAHSVGKWDGSRLKQEIYAIAPPCRHITALLPPKRRRGPDLEIRNRVQGSSLWISPASIFSRAGHSGSNCNPVVQTWSPLLVENIQALRGAAAILVMVMHAFSTAKEFYAFYAERDPYVEVVGRIFGSIGVAGVDTFFVISGFIILTVAMRCAQYNVYNFAPATAGLFYLRRLTRIYPVYWIALIAAATSTSFVQPGRWEAITEHPAIIFLTASKYDDVPTAWSLTFELYFYSVVALGLLLACRRLLIFIAAWAAVQVAVIGAATLSASEAGTTPGIFANPLILEFLFGCIIAVAIQRGFSRFALAAILFGAVMLYIGAALAWPRDELTPWERVAVFGVGAAFLVYGLVAHERNKGFVLPGLRWAGDASYSIYLWHVPVYWTANWTGVRWGIYEFMPCAMTPLVWTALGLAVGVFGYWVIERPMLAAVRSRFPSTTLTARASSHVCISGEGRANN